MSILQFIWVGDLDENKTQRLQNPQAIFQERCHPMTMAVKQDKKETRIGRKNSRMPPDYTLESAMSNRMISRNHVTIERLSKGNYMLYDHSLNGTYVNYCRVIGGTILKNDDIVCFGHINGANIKPGESVTPFTTDLKYRVKIVEQDRERMEQLSASSGDDVTPNILESRKRIKLPKHKSSHSDHSSDSSLTNKNYVKRKKPHLMSTSCSDDEHKDRSLSKKSKKHSVPEIDRKHKFVSETRPIKSKVREHKRSRPHEDRRDKERLIYGKDHQRNKQFSDNKSFQRNGNNNSSSYDYEECRARPCRRPDGENPIDWIMCDKCNQWFHQFCVGLDEELEDDESYYCPYCAHQ